MIKDILEMDRKIRERAKEIYDFVNGGYSLKPINLPTLLYQLRCYDVYQILSDFIVFSTIDYDQVISSDCPIKYFGDNWKELILEDSKLLEDSRIERDKKLADNKIESDKREYLRLKNMFEGDGE